MVRHCLSHIFKGHMAERKTLGNSTRTSLPPPRKSVPPPVIADVYDRLVAEHYDDDPFGIIGSARRQALTQISEHSALKPGVSICDFGVGTGDAIVELGSQVPDARLWGVDVSEGMLIQARRKLRARDLGERSTLIQSCATQVGPQLGPRSMDLAVTHFLLNYVEHEALFQCVAQSMRPGALWSLVTSRWDSFPGLAALARQFLPREFQPELHCGVPTSPERVTELLDQHGFEIVLRDLCVVPLKFENFDHLLSFVKHSGWFAGEVLNHVETAQIDALRMASQDLFPLTDEARIEVILSQRL